MTRRRLPQVPAFAIAALVLVLATLGIVGFVIVLQMQTNDQLRAQYDTLHQEYEGLYQEAVDAGADPEAPAPDDVPSADPQEPQIVIGTAGPQGERGFAGVPGPQGRTGPPGETGPRGPSGPRGEPGEDSTVPGPAGIDGLNGTDGRGIQSMQCATGGWVIKYTDLTTAPDPGPCQGPQGAHGVQGPQGAPGPQGTAKPGDYACPDGEVMTGFTVAEDGAVTLACKDDAPPVIDTP